MNRHKYALSLSIVIFCCTVLHAQYNRTTLKGVDTTRNSVEARLVKLAIANNPSGKIAVYKSNAAEKAVRIQQRWFMETVRISGNLNEFTVNPDAYVRSQYFPRYNFGITVTIGDLFNQPALVQTRKIESEVARLEAEGTKQSLRTEVLKRYNHYLSIKDMLTIQKKMESETGINMELARSKFNKGTESYDVLSTLMEKYYTLQISVKTMEEALNEAELDLEAIIGVDLETVVRP